LFWAYTLPILYWAYLILTTNFILVFDSEDYYDLGSLFYHGQWLQYFQTGPHREPLYPLVVASSMLAGKWMGIPYTYILKIFSFGFLAATMVIIQQALKVLQARRWIVAATILYTGFSPILINSALCLYSEIATLPWLAACVLLSVYFLRCLEGTSKNFTPARGLGSCLLGFTLVKAVGEALAPLFLFWLCLWGWQRSKLKLLAFLRKSKAHILLVFLVFYIPLLGYKSINYIFNKHFTVTNRSTMALYGNLNLRSRSPLTMNNFLSHLSTVPVSYDLCSRFFGQKCYHWTMSASDETFLTRQDQLIKQNIDPARQEKIFARETVQAFFGHPVVQLVYLVQEGLRIFFWETSQGAFVVYPPWLEKLFNLPGVVVLMSLGVGLFCLAGYFAAAKLLKNELVLITFVLTSLLVLLFGFVLVLHRYAIIAAPLMILLNASCLSMIIARASGFFASKTR
jgi:hypothetical protein